ncbi:hypothetical protein DIPPA_02987 [Diplonema papillatum]|nr:hypothetical protein DIPPA_02987 [Diplonema papillatum]
MTDAAASQAQQKQSWWAGAMTAVGTALGDIVEDAEQALDDVMGTAHIGGKDGGGAAAKVPAPAAAVPAAKSKPGPEAGSRAAGERQPGQPAWNFGGWAGKLSSAVERVVDAASEFVNDDDEKSTAPSASTPQRQPPSPAPATCAATPATPQAESPRDRGTPHSTQPTPLPHQGNSADAEPSTLLFTPSPRGRDASESKTSAAADDDTPGSEPVGTPRRELAAEDMVAGWQAKVWDQPPGCGAEGFFDESVNEIEMQLAVQGGVAFETLDRMADGAAYFLKEKAAAAADEREQVLALFVRKIDTALRIALVTLSSPTRSPSAQLSPASPNADPVSPVRMHVGLLKTAVTSFAQLTSSDDVRADADTQ